MPGRPPCGRRRARTSSPRSTTACCLSTRPMAPSIPRRDAPRDDAIDSARAAPTGKLLVAAHRPAIMGHMAQQGGSQPPPMPRPKRRNAVWLLYDAPIVRDWAFWLTAGWAILAGSAIGTGPRANSSMPLWLDTGLAIVVFAGLFGALPAFLRLWLRRWLWRRRQPPSPVIEAAAPNRPRFQPLPSAPANDRALTQPGVQLPETSFRAEVNSFDQVVDLRDAEHDGVIEQVRVVMPYPVARAARRLATAPDALSEYQRVLQCSEALIVAIGVSCAAWLRVNALGADGLNRLQQAYERGVSLGTWLDVIRLAASQRGQAIALPGFLEATRKERGGEQRLLADLRFLLEERNKSAHGGMPRDRIEARARVTELSTPLSSSLSRSLFLADAPWLRVASSAFRRRERHFVMVADKLMGDHPEFQRVTFTSTSVLANDTVYMIPPQRPPIDLTPFVVLRPCPECRQSELFYADRLDVKRGAVLKSFDRGHIVHDQELAEELRSLNIAPQTGQSAR